VRLFFEGTEMSERWYLLLLVLLFAACSDSTSSQPPVESMETTDRAMIEENTDIFIPQSAAGLHGYLEGFRETTFYIKFSMPADEQVSLLESSVCETPLHDHAHQVIFIDTTDHQEYIVYIVDAWY
jgi:hypothetical protein